MVLSNARKTKNEDNISLMYRLHVHTLTAPMSDLVEMVGFVMTIYGMVLGWMTQGMVWGEMIILVFLRFDNFEGKKGFTFRLFGC